MEPVFILSTDAATFDPRAYEVYKAQTHIYKIQLAKYEKQQKVFADLITFIQDTITVQNATYIQKEEPHPWNQLRALKTRLAPSYSARCIEIEIKYHRLCKGSGKQDIETWLDEWQTVYTDGKAYGVGEMMGTRPIRDFIMAVLPTEPSFANAHLITLDSKEEKDFHPLIESFRKYVRLHQTQKNMNNNTHSAFATEKKKEGQGATFNGQKTPPKCLCGSVHGYNDCYYLVLEKWPSNWTSRPQIQTQIDEAMKDQQLKAKVEKSLQRSKEIQQLKATKTTNTNTNNTEKELGAFTSTKTSSSFSADSYTIKSSWILDNGSNINVCNNTMKSRYTQERKSMGEYLTAGTQRLAIESYGTVKITVSTPTGLQSITLLNVAYVSNFMTNLVSQDLLYVKGLYFNNWKNHLHREGKTVAYVKRYDGHYLLEDNTSSDQASVFLVQQKPKIATNKTATAYEWQQMLAHASDESIQHLESSTRGVKISEESEGKVPKTNECEPCALSKAHRIVSRSSENAETSNEPFYRITYDLMQLNTAMNKDEWVSHFACHATDFNMVFTHPHKGDASKICKEAINLIETRFKAKVVFIRSDRERSLGNNFNDLLVEKGITHESSTPYTPEQNGHSERKGGILAMKARALRIDAGLPIFLWPEIVRTAGYIANRIPMKKHQWKTPYELVIGNPPDLSHLHHYRCKAYTLNKQIQKKQKLQERAHIGHLVGYEARNIFRVWIPSQRKVIRTRDVIFNENTYYDAHDIDLLQAVNEPMSFMIWIPSPLSPK